DANDQARSSNVISIAAGTHKTVRVRVTVPSVTSGAGALHVDVTSSVAGTNIQPGSASPITLTIGSAAPVPDNRVTISPSTTLPILGGRVMVTRNAAPVGVRFNLVLNDPADYAVTVSL